MIFFYFASWGRRTHIPSRSEKTNFAVLFLETIFAVIQQTASRRYTRPLRHRCTAAATQPGSRRFQRGALDLLEPPASPGQVPAACEIRTHVARCEPVRLWAGAHSYHLVQIRCPVHLQSLRLDIASIGDCPDAAFRRVGYSLAVCHA